MNLLKKIPKILLILAILLPTSLALAFTDISYSNSHNEAIQYLQGKGVIQGYSDGSFHPDSPINRAEFLKILLEAKTPGTAVAQGQSNCFPDVADAWYAPYVCYAKSQSIVSGYPDGNFLPANNINLAEALKMVLETYEISFTKGDPWYEPYFNYANTNEILSKINKSLSHSVTRGEMTQLIYNIESYLGLMVKSPSAPSPQPIPPTQSPATTGRILDLPFPENLDCVLNANRELSRCTDYYVNNELICPPYFNPVTGKDGLFYPSSCWAEQLGTSVEFYGYSPTFIQFFKDLWAIKKVYGVQYIVPNPNIEFAYSAGISDLDTLFRSTLWSDANNYISMSYYLSNYAGGIPSNFYSTNTVRSSVPIAANETEKVDILLAFTTFDDVYPDDVLLKWTQTYEPFMNDYIQKKQNLAQKIEFKITPVVIEPPSGVERQSSSHLYFSEEEIESMYEDAIQIAGTNDFKIFAVAPVVLNGFGGYYSFWNDEEFIVAGLNPSNFYSATNKQEGLQALAAFQGVFLTLSHEILHALGLRGDHMPMGYGTYYLDSIGSNVNPLTGYKDSEGPTNCDFFGTSPDYYGVDLPTEFKIHAGEEPSWLDFEESSSGDCLHDNSNEVFLKDFDHDGEYEMMYKNNLIGIELQRSLGWIDIDEDGVAELEDQDAYGGWQAFPQSTDSIVLNDLPMSPIEPLGEETINGCIFERIRLNDGTEGITPLICPDFYPAEINLYRGVNYNWDIEESVYGEILIPILE